MKRKFFTALTFAIAFIAISLSGIAQTYERDYLDGKIYFKYKDDVQLDIPVNPDKTVDIDEVPFLDALQQSFSITGVSRPYDLNNDQKLLRTFEISFTEFNQVEELIEELVKNQDLEYIEKAALPHLDYTPNDSLYTLDFGNSNWNWHLDVINAEMAWDLQQGDPDIKVAIIDNAVWTDHPDLENKIFLSYDVIYNVNSSNPPAGGDPEEWSHGTHCAGLSGADTDNETGVASIGFNISLIGIKATTNTYPGGVTDYLAGINWAASNGADVISMSFGSSAYNQTAQNVINVAHNMGVVLFGSAGNENSLLPRYPASYNNVISVASTNEDDVKSNFSSYGVMVDICAPGGYGTNGPSGLLSTTYDETGYGFYDVYFGTSMSTPLAAGLGGLILSVNPDLTPDEVENILESTCVDIYSIPGNENYTGFLGAGRIDAYAAISNTPYSPAADFMTPVTTIIPGTSIQFFDQSAGVPNTWSWEFQGGIPALSNLQNPSVVFPAAGVYTVQLTVTNNFGTNTEIKSGYITVTSNPAPWVLFSSDMTYACNKDTIAFIDESLYQPITWNWSFEPSTITFVNGTSAASQNPEVRFEAPGTYTVSLTAGSANGSNTATIEDMITIEGIVMNFSEDFESGNSQTFILGKNSRAKVNVDKRSASPGSTYGLHFQGSSITGGWSGGPVNTTPAQAWATNINFHSWAEVCSVDATGIAGIGLTFDLRQTFSIGKTYSWFRVLVDGEQVADVYGDENFNPETNTDPFETKIFDLSSYANSQFSLTFQASCYLSDKFYAEGDNVFLDNIIISNTTPVNEAGSASAGVITYPNPVKDVLNYSAHGIGHTMDMKIMNVHGQLLKSLSEKNYQNGEIRRIHLSELAPGLYILQLSGDQGVVTKKFVVE